MEAGLWATGQRIFGDCVMPRSSASTGQLPPIIPPPDLPRLPRRRLDTSKRDYGRVVIIGGSAGMAGAPALAAMAALRSGAGIVEMLVPQAVVAIAASFDPCLLTRGLPSNAEGTFDTSAIAEIIGRVRLADAVAIGPGMGRSAAVAGIVQHLWAELLQPAVFDADALWGLSQMDLPQRAEHAGPRLLTPHVGEMLGLLPTDYLSEHLRPDALEHAAADMARAIHAVVVLKGPATFVVDPQQQIHNETGNPGMATGGTGDVLTGIAAALLGQHLQPFAAARMAVWVHGRAGDCAAAVHTERSMTATDVIAALPQAFQTVLATEA